MNCPTQPHRMLGAPWRCHIVGPLVGGWGCSPVGARGWAWVCACPLVAMRAFVHNPTNIWGRVCCSQWHQPTTTPLVPWAAAGQNTKCQWLAASTCLVAPAHCLWGHAPKWLLCNCGCAPHPALPAIGVLHAQQCCTGPHGSDGTPMGGPLQLWVPVGLAPALGCTKHHARAHHLAF